MANKEISLKLKELRMQAGLTQKQAYEKLGVSQSTFSSWEVGKSEPDAKTFLAICEMYKIYDILGAFGYCASDDSADELEPFDTDEKQLLRNYRQLTDEGKEFVRQTTFVALNTYKKDPYFSIMEAREEIA